MEETELERAKQRALALLHQGKPIDALARFLRDIEKNPELNYPPFIIQIGLLRAVEPGARGLEEWIQGFH